MLDEDLVPQKMTLLCYWGACEELTILKAIVDI